MQNDIHSIGDHAREEISKASTLKDVHDLKVKYLGKKGILTELLKSLKSLPKEDRPTFGNTLNEIKKCAY